MQASQLGRLQNLLRSCAPSGGDTLLSSGANTLTVPSGSDIVLIVPAPNNTTSITVKGVAGDTGVAAVTNFPIVLTLASGNIVLTVGADVRVQLLWGKTSALSS